MPTRRAREGYRDNDDGEQKDDGRRMAGWAIERSERGGGGGEVTRELRARRKTGRRKKRGGAKREAWWWGLVTEANAGAPNDGRREEP